MSARLSLRTATVALTAGGLALTGAVLTSAPASADNRTVVFTTELNGANEAPAPGDEDGTGRALVRVKGSQICLDVRVSDIAFPAIGTHIHEKAAGANTGPVVVNFVPVGDDGKRKQCADNAAVAQGILDDPAEYYVNVHNADFPGGAIRGDLG